MLSCGFEPLNKTINLDKIVISKKVFSGNSQINKKIFNKLSLKESNNVSDFVLKMHSENKIKILAKNTEGDATSYKTSLSIKVSLIKNNKIIKDKLFEKSITYPNLNNKFELSKYQKEVENNLINTTLQRIKVFLSF
jgi:hypothetical protein